MDQNCIFCQIAQGKVAAKRVYDDEKCAAVLDINPAAKGHMLLLPKTHAAVLPQLHPEEAGHLLAVAKSLSNALLRAYKAGGTTIFLANGAVAGQRAPHLMIHIIPRFEGDGLGLILPKKGIAPDDLQKCQELLLPKVSKAFGLSDDIVAKWKVTVEKMPPKITEANAEQKTPPAGPEAQPVQDNSKKEVDLDMISRLFK